MRDLAISPDGKRLAVVANFGTPHFQLFLTKRNDFRLEKARPQPVWACEVMWRGDSRELVVVQQGSTCQDPVGEILRVPLRHAATRCRCASAATAPTTRRSTCPKGEPLGRQRVGELGAR